jgi:nicotinamidase-related amidase
MADEQPDPGASTGRGWIGPNERNGWRAADGRVDLTRPLRPARPITIPGQLTPITLDLARTAVVVVDMQNDFCRPDGWFASIGVDVTPGRTPIAPLRESLPVLRDAGVPIVWVDWGNRPDRANLPPGVLHVYDPQGEGTGIGSSAKTGSPALQEGSWGAAIVDELVPAPQDVQISKYRMSGFWDTPLDSVLRNLLVTTVLFAGINVDQCVLATLIDAACAGYDVVLLEDCAATTSPSYCWDATLYNVRECFGFTATMADVVAAVAPPASPPAESA